MGKPLKSVTRIWFITSSLVARCQAPNGGGLRLIGKNTLNPAGVLAQGIYSLGLTGQKRRRGIESPCRPWHQEGIRPRRGRHGASLNPSSRI